MGTLEITERSTSPYTFDKEHGRDTDMDLIRVARHLSRWYIVVYEDGTKSTQFVHDKNIPIEVEAIKEVKRKNTDIGYVGWHVITAIEWQDGTLEEMDLTEPKRFLQEAIENTRNNIAYALEQINLLNKFYDSRKIDAWENEVAMQTTCLNRYVELLNKITK